MIPVSIISQADPKKIIKHFIMSSEKTSVELENIPADHWVKINPGAIDFYRVQYSSELLQKVIPRITDLSLPAIDRLSLQDDHFALVCHTSIRHFTFEISASASIVFSPQVKNGTGCTVDTLKLMEAFHNETDYNAWSSISRCLKDLKTMLDGSSALKHLNNFGKKLFLSIYSSLEWDYKPDECLYFLLEIRFLFVNFYGFISEI